MGTVVHVLTPNSANLAATGAPALNEIVGTNFRYSVLSYDAATDEEATWEQPVLTYGSGNITADIEWEAETATSGDTMWGVSVACITPVTDAQDKKTKTFGTEATQTGAASSPAHRQFKTSITVTSLDSITSGDQITIKIRRIGTDGSDNMAGDANFVRALVSYSDV